MQQTIARTFFHRASAMADRTCVRYKEVAGPYRDMTWSDLSRMVKEMAFGLASMGFQPGQRAAIMSQTSHLWVAADLSIMANGAVSVPIYPTSSHKDIHFILENSEAQFVFVQNEHLLNKVLAEAKNLANLKKIILLNALSRGRSLSDLDIAPNLVIGLEELQEAGRIFVKQNANLIDERVSQSQSDNLATIIYTSGTTGTPKGVMLTYDNVFGVIKDLPSVLPISDKDVYLAFLPMSHIFERVCGEFYWIVSGGVYAFAEGIEHVAKNMAEIEPSMILVVPRVLDRIYAKVKAGIQGASGRARKLIEWSLAVGKENFRLQGRKPRIGLQAKLWLAEKLVFQKLRNRIGRNLRLVVSGGAPATGEVIEFFNAIGITTIEGYGLTETTAPVTANRQENNKPGTVGPTLPSVEIKIDNDGEILVKGPGVFSGYFKDDVHTKEAFDEQGWFRTGDIGIIDGEGYLTITDRKKDLIVNSAGKNIAPQLIESLLKTIPIIAQAVVFGDRRKHLVAILALDEHIAVELAQEKGWSFNAYSDLTKLPELHKLIRRDIQNALSQVADYERVRNFAILEQDLSIENGELTATLKVKRNVVATKYKSLIESLYHEEREESPQSSTQGSGRSSPVSLV